MCEWKFCLYDVNGDLLLSKKEFLNFYKDCNKIMKIEITDKKMEKEMQKTMN